MDDAAPGSEEARDIVAAMLVRDGRVLLCHRCAARRWYPDVWDLPGGHVEGGESPGTALAREVYERACAAGAEIVYPITDEEWGLRRFFVRDPNGAVINVTEHRE